VEGLATHAGFESCATVRKFSREALTEESVGEVLSRESTIQRADESRGADAVRRSGRPQSRCRYGKVPLNSARSETLGMQRNNSCENRESPCLSKAVVVLDRIVKSKDVRR
jgi:hypothetical protein